MKKRLKGLVSLWLVVVMVCSMMPVPAMAETAGPVDAFLYTADTSPVPGGWCDSHEYEYVSLAFGTPLIEQAEIMNTLSLPAGSVLNGWTLWSTDSGGYVSSSIPSQTIGKNDSIDSATWSTFGDEYYTKYLMIQPLWFVKYRINPQPTNDEPTVGGEIKVTDAETGEETWKTTTDVTYQWCEVTIGEKTYTVGQEITPDFYYGSYVTDQSYWSSEIDEYSSDSNHMLAGYLPVQAGDVLTVTFSREVSGTVNYEEFTGSNYTETVAETNEYYALYFNDDSAFTATITITRGGQTIYTDLSDQTAATLDLTKIDAGTYACRLTFDPNGDKVVMLSNTVTYTDDDLPPDNIVWVGGQGMYASTDGTVVTYYTNGTDGAVGTVSATEPEQWHAKLYYDTASNAYTLEINGLDAVGVTDDTTSLGAGIYSTVPLALSFGGTNTVDGLTNSNTSYGIYAPGLTLTGADGASLTVNSVDSSNSYGIYSTAPVTINSGTISAYAGVASGSYSHAIHAVGGFVLNDGNVTAQSRNATTRSSAIYSAQSSTSAADGSILINDGTLTAKSTSTNWVKYSHAISAQGAITIQDGTINATSGSAYHTSCGIHACVTDYPDDQYNGCSADGCKSPITINGGVITARTEGDTFQSQNRAIYSHDIVTITDGNVTAISNGEATDDFSYGLGGYNGIHISGGTVTAQGDTSGGSMFSSGLYCDWDLIISGDAHIIATGGAARVYSYGTYCWRNFHMSGDAYLRSVADITTTPNPEEIHDDNPRRSIGLYMSAGVYEPSTPVVDDYFTITGGTLEAWCVTSEESCSTENYAVKMFDVVDDDFIFSDTAQPNDTWYKWTLETDNNGAPVNMIWSTKTQYVHADDKENYKSTYLYITPMEEIHEVTFDSMGGSEVTPNPVEVENGATVAKPADPTKTNHSFLGWFTSEDNGVTFSDEEYDFSTPVVSDLTLYAQWKEIPQYTVKYELNGGTGATGVDYAAQTVDAGTKIIVKAEPSLAGHRFESWSDGTTEYAAGDEITVDSDITLTAQWVKQYTVTYDLNGGTGAEGVDYTTQTVDEGTEITVKAEPGLAGHRFDCWSDGTTNYAADDEITVESDITLTAKWVKQYTVKYELNGGTGAEGVDYTTQTVDEGTKIAVKAEPGLAGHRFDSWSDGTTEYAAGDEITVDSDITLTAQWLKQYTVKYELNGGTGAEGVDYTTQTVDAGTKIIVKAEPSLAGHRFESWSDGTTEYAAGDEITVNSDITLTAKWVKQYTVTLDSNGADLIMEINGIAAGESANEAFNRQAGTEAKDAGEALAPTRDGYTFGGWYTDKDTWKNKYDFDSKVTADITVYAKWEEDAPPVVDPPVIDPPVVISGTASLTKVDAEDPTTVLSGVVFELYRLDGALMGTYTTNAYGQITVYGLVPGTYYWRETRPAEGYVLDGTERVFTVYAGQTTSLVVENERSGVPGVFSGDHYAYVIGYDDGMVHPEANITRAEVATIFFRLLDEETRARYMTRSNSFSDVEEGMWFNTAVSTMAAMGIVTGRPDGTFDPNANITRAEFAAIAARFDANGNTSDASFTDIYGHWAMKEINIAANNGWVLGYEDGSFRPNQLITRAEAMTMVNRVLQRIPEHPEDLLDHMVTWPDNMDTSKWYYLMVQEATNSHDYHRKGNGYEYWTGLRQVPDWAALEN